MKHFKFLSLADLLVWVVPLLLTVPNLYVCLLSRFSFAACMATVWLPFGVYIGLMSLSRHTPRTTMELFPLMFVGAFQIVVSSLYRDGSPIGVDMFLNVGTTNVTEVNELLSSLWVPVFFVAALYLPLLIAAVIGWRRHQLAGNLVLRHGRKAGAMVGMAGLAACVYCLASQPAYRLTTDLFPVNACYNLKEAIVRHARMADYKAGSATFRYSATDDRPPERELYIAVIGETSRADNWGLAGYNRPTNPRLRRYGDSLMFFRKVFSESNTTHKSVPMLLSTLSSENYGEEIYRHKSIITAFKEAGFHTTFLSVQKPNRSFIEYYAGEAHTVRYVTGANDLPVLDGEVLPLVDSVMADTTHRKNLIVIHLYGSHYDYADRYPKACAVFMPDLCRQANWKNRSELLNAYDNTIVYTDYLLAELVARARSVVCHAALLYTSDHGEDIFDDARRKFLHASPVPTYWQLHVPFLIYMNPSYSAAHPQYRAHALQNRWKLVSSSKSYAQTLLQMAGIRSSYCDSTQSLLCRDFAPASQLRYLTDLNESVNLMEWGFGDFDKSKFNQWINDENE